MPSNLFMAESEFPQFKEGQSFDEKLNVVLNYLHMMREQLRYTLANVGDSNINKDDISELIKTVNTPVITVVEDLKGDVSSKIEQQNDRIIFEVSEARNELESSFRMTANSITLSVSDDNDGAFIKLSVGDTERGSVYLGGYATFLDLENPRSGTVIHGGNIQTGTITADKLSARIAHVADEVQIGESSTYMSKCIRFSSGTYIEVNPDGNMYISAPRINLGASEIYIDGTPLDVYIANSI